MKTCTELKNIERLRLFAQTGMIEDFLRGHNIALSIIEGQFAIAHNGGEPIQIEESVLGGEFILEGE